MLVALRNSKAIKWTEANCIFIPKAHRHHAVSRVLAFSQETSHLSWPSHFTRKYAVESLLTTQIDGKREAVNKRDNV